MCQSCAVFGCCDGGSRTRLLGTDIKLDIARLGCFRCFFRVAGRTRYFIKCPAYLHCLRLIAFLAYCCGPTCQVIRYLGSDILVGKE